MKREEMLTILQGLRPATKIRTTETEGLLDCTFLTRDGVTAKWIGDDGDWFFELHGITAELIEKVADLVRECKLTREALEGTEFLTLYQSVVPEKLQDDGNGLNEFFAGVGGLTPNDEGIVYSYADFDGAEFFSHYGEVEKKFMEMFAVPHERWENLPDQVLEKFIEALDTDYASGIQIFVFSQLEEATEQASEQA